MASVYVFRTGNRNLFKIGRTRGDVEKRRKELATGNPEPLTTFAVVETAEASVMENFLHKTLGEYRIRGSDAKEHFAVSEQLIRDALEKAEEFIRLFSEFRDSASEFEGIDNTVDALPADNEAKALYEDLHRINDQIAELRYQKQFLEFQLKAKIGPAAGIEGIATWKASEVSRFSESDFREAEPELHRKFTKTRIFRKFHLV